MIVYLEIPSRRSRRHAKQMPHSMQKAGYVCDDCLNEKRWEDLDVKETTLKGIWKVESFDRWDSNQQRFVTGLHLCRHHAIKRRWRTDEYRGNVVSAATKVIQSYEHRLKKATTGKFLYENEKKQKRRDDIIHQVFKDWNDRRLDFSKVAAEDLHLLKYSVSPDDRTSRKTGAYRYYPGLEKWLAQELCMTELDVHRTLLEYWLSRNGSLATDIGAQIIVNGLAGGDKYNRYHGYVAKENLEFVTFSSSLELMFILDCLASGGDIIRADDAGIVIGYNYKGRVRQYHPDFLCNSNAVIEVKSKREIAKPMNLIKATCCAEYCEHRGMDYRIVTEDNLSSDAEIMARSATSAWLDEHKSNAGNLPMQLGFSFN